MPSDEFLAYAKAALNDILEWQDPASQDFIKTVEYAADYQAPPEAKAATGTPQDWTLLGMYQQEPYPKITIYEQSIRKLLPLYGNMKNAVQSVLEHEIFQHHFGMDHTKETSRLGLAPAYAISPYGEELEQWKLQTPAPCSCGCGHCGG